MLARLLEWLRAHTNDRIVIVSNYTQTLDLFGSLCREKCVRMPGWPRTAWWLTTWCYSCTGATRSFVWMAA